MIESMLFSRQQAKPVRDKITSSVLNNPAKKLNLFERSFDQKIEVRDGRESNVFSPKTGVTFLKGQNSTIDWQGDALDVMIEGTDTARYSSIQASSSGLRPGSHRQLAAKHKSPRVSQMQLKESMLRQSYDRVQNLNKTATAGFGVLSPANSKINDLKLNNLGKITNYKKTEGINDQSMRGSFRKWTGMPQTTRNGVIPSLIFN